MKRLIFLKQEYVDETILNKSEVIKAYEKYFLQSIKSFKAQLKEQIDNNSFKILKEVRPNAILIEFDSEDYDKLYEKFCKADIVAIIDSIIPKELK